MPEFIKVLLNKLHDAMITNDLDLLEHLLAEHYSLMHITGYQQPKEEWFDVISSGQFNYHQITIDDSSLLFNDEQNKATLTGEGIYDATIYGNRQPWPLKFTHYFRESENGWIFEKSLYRLGDDF